MEENMVTLNITLPDPMKEFMDRQQKAMEGE